MRKIIRFVFYLFGINVYFVKRREAKNLSAFETWKSGENEHANKKISKGFESKGNILFHQHVISKVLDQDMDMTHKRVCDAGCGNGILLNIIHDRFKPVEITGMDFSEDAIRIAKKRNIEHAVFKTHNLYDPIENDPFDVIFCTEVLEHLAYPDIALKHLVGALASGGTAMITVPNGRLDFWEGHFNFWSVFSWEVFLKRTLEGTGTTIASGFFDKKNIHLYALIRKI
jgi:2-polyprenyl-3-methyl-5-hydroxy-6-metoxy-1,4-benzoquinol methylase